MRQLEPALPIGLARDPLSSGMEPVLGGRWEIYYSVARLEDDTRTRNGRAWAVPLEAKLREIDRLADSGEVAALAYLRKLLRRCAAEGAQSAGRPCDFRYLNARGSLAEALVHWELWFDGERVLEHKSDAVLHLESALARLETSFSSRLAC